MSFASSLAVRARRIPIVKFVAALLAASSGDAAAAVPVACDASAFGCASSGPCVIERTWRVGAECTLDFGTRAVEIRGALRAADPGGSFRIVAGDLTLAGGKLQTNGGREVFAGILELELGGALVMRGDGARIEANSPAGGGFIDVVAQSATLAGVIAARGGAGPLCGDAGFITIETTGALESHASVRASAAGRNCGGGVVLLYGGTTTMSGPVDARGGYGGGQIEIGAQSADGDLVLERRARLRADGTGQDLLFGSNGGSVSLAAGRDIVVGAAASARGHMPSGDGGSVDLTAGGRIDIAAPLSATGGGYGFGGTVLADAGGDVTVRADVAVAVRNQRPVGGSGGVIAMKSAARLETRSIWDVSGVAAGSILVVGNPLAMSGRFLARGNLGEVRIDGCGADIQGTIDATRAQLPLVGISVKTGTLNVGPAARLMTGPCSGEPCFVLTTRPGGLSIAPGALLAPAPAITEDALLPTCGASVVAP